MPLKVLMMNRPENTWIGGDMVQLKATARELYKLGHEVDFGSNPQFHKEDIAEADIVHLWNLSMPWTFCQYVDAKKARKKIIISTIYHATDRFISWEHQQWMINGADALIFLCPGEVERVRAILNVPQEKVHIIPNGIEDYWFESFKSEDDFILTVGRLEEFKGQRDVAIACKELGLKYVCIGDGEDAELLRELGAEVISSINRPDLVRYYARCKAFVLASCNEIFPLSVMEAGAQDKPIVLTDESLWQPDGALNCKYQDVESIKTAIVQALTGKGKIDVSDCMWDRVALQVEAVYHDVLAPKPKITGNKKISVIMPCYSQAHYMQDAIDSVRAQTYQNYEIIAVMDGPKDNSREIAEKNGLIIVDLPQNGGIPNAFNKGLEVATGDYIVALSQDDMFDESYFQKSVRKFEEDENIGVVTCQMLNFGNTNEFMIFGHNWTLEALLQQNQIQGSSLVKKECYDKLGGWDLQAEEYSDWEMWTRICKDGYGLGYIKEPLFLFRQHGKNISNGYRRDLAGYIRSKQQGEAA